jgi:hypothetical protein
MTLQNKGSARTPGPLGISPGSVGGRVPGPLGNRLWDKQSAPSGQPTPVKAVKKTVMPLPTNDHDSKDVHVVTGPLFSSDRGPALEEVQQAPGIANCPVAAILAALAFTPIGRPTLQGMLSESAATVLTDVSGLPPDTLSNPPPGNTLTSSRYFTVKLPSGPIEVSDVLYTDDHDAGWSPWYMRDPRGQTIWASIIEKALAVHLKSYENFDALNISANEFWKKITGVLPRGFEIKKDTPLSQITEAAKAATRIPSIAATKPDVGSPAPVSPFHGYAMMGLAGAKIKLYDPADAKIELLTPTEVRNNFQAILFHK